MTISATHACKIWTEDCNRDWSLPVSPYSYTSYLQLRAKGSLSPDSASPLKTWPRCPGPEAAPRLRRRAQTDPTYRAPSDFIFTPSTPPKVVPARSPSFISKKSASYPQLHQHSQRSAYAGTFEPIYPSSQLLDMSSDSDGDASDDTVYAARPLKNGSANGRVRSRHTSSKKSLDIPKVISTSPSVVGLGETETEFEEQVRFLLHIC